MAQRENWLVVGISGVTCGGKTTLSRRLLSSVSPSFVFEQDKYFYPDDSPRHVKVEGLETPHNNYDILSALDMDAMYSDIMSTLEGEDKAHNRNLSGVNALTLPGKQLLIVEGFTVLNYKPIMELCDLRYYLVLEYGECVSRRVLRLYDPPDVPGYFDKCVWPEHCKYRAEIEKDPRVRFIDGNMPDVFNLLLQDLTRYGLTQTH